MIWITLLAMAAAQALPPAEARTMIRDARTAVRRHGATLWPGFADAPWSVDLIGPDRETLFCRAPPTGFAAAGRDPVTGCAVSTRSRVLPPDLAASTDLSGAATIQIGTPRALEINRAAWIVTLLHESFHQYQAALPGYEAAVAALGLRRPGEDGSWALTYPFPYKDERVGMAFAAMSTAAAAFLSAREPAAARSAMVRYAAARRAAAAVVGPTAWRYYEFQVGQEGVARWTEIRLAQIVGKRDPAIAAVAADRRGGLATSLRAIDEQGFSLWKRSAFYVFGAIEAEMLDRFRPGWQRSYRRAPFAMGARLDEAATALAEGN